jgi:hypothetical protein
MSSSLVILIADELDVIPFNNLMVYLVYPILFLFFEIYLMEDKKKERNNLSF